MDQRFIELGFEGSDTHYTIHGVSAAEAHHSASAIAPPGYYMLFIFNEDGEPSVGHYVKVGQNLAMQWVCEATSALTAQETSCTTEPVGGACPTGDETTIPVALPDIDGPSGTVDGFYAFVDYDVVHDPLAPTASELLAIEQACTNACDAHFVDQLGVTTSCGAPTAFVDPIEYGPAETTLDLLRDDERHGEGVFAGQSLTCDLGTTCHAEFDEYLARASLDRSTPGESALGQGEEYQVALGSGSKVLITAGTQTQSSGLTGSVGYSHCRDGHESSPCPFYLGSLTAAASSSMTVTMQCEDGSRERVQIDNLVMSLVQPAFGIAEGGNGATDKGFVGGSLIVETSFDANGEHHRVRRSSRVAATMSVDGETFSANGLQVGIRVPCNGSTADAVVGLTLTDPGDGSTLAAPPQVAILTPSTVPCGVPTTLSASVSDPDQDLDSVRWIVDGVLMSAGTSQMTFTEPHWLEVVAQDARGAASTDRRFVACQ